MALTHEPHKTKVVRPLPAPSAAERKRYLAEAHFNVALLTPDQVAFDMCAIGTSAASQEQRAGALVGDEAYAGARNFSNLQDAVAKVFGQSYVCPAHNGVGCVKLVLATQLTADMILPSNARTRLEQVGHHGIPYPDVRTTAPGPFTGDIDLAKLAGLLEEAGPGGALVGVQAFADGQHPFSLQNLRATRALAEKHGCKLILDASRVIENAWYIQRHEPGQRHHSVAEITTKIAKTCHILQLDGGHDAKCATGGLLATDDPTIHEHFINEVVVYEGLHTYGGMSGRALEELARGIVEMTDEAEVAWVMSQTERFTARLLAAGVPLERGCDGAYLHAGRFLPHLSEHQQDALSAALYLASGVRAFAPGRVGRDTLVPVQIPRLAMVNAQLDQVADAIISVYAQRAAIGPLHQINTEVGVSAVGASGVGASQWRDQQRYHGAFPGLQPFTFDTVPYLVHTFERVGALDRAQRQRAMAQAGYNTFLLRSEDVTIDLLTDSGTSAMSTAQWAARDAAWESLSPSAATQRFAARMQAITGYKHILPTHQGRAAEHILSELLIGRSKRGARQIVPGNMYFTTTKLHQEMAGGVFADVIVDEAHQAESTFPWKGNVDLDKLAALVDRHGADGIAYLSLELSVNMAGGQPVSMDNLRRTYAWCEQRGIPVMFDATRVVENARMIQQRDARYTEVSVRDIVREMMLYSDGCTVSGKKDFLINIGGVLCFRDSDTLAERARELLRIYEGDVYSGGLSHADMAAMADGVEEMLDDRYIRARVAQTATLAQRLKAAGVPIVEPPGSHAVFVDARRFLPHVDQDAFPAQRLAAEIYIETGVRCMERGNVSKGRNPETGENYRPALELVRLTLPRRVYSDDHMAAVADGIARLYARRETIGGLRLVYEPAKLRFFQARFEPVA